MNCALVGYSAAHVLRTGATHPNLFDRTHTVGDVSGYSVSSFYPKQEFQVADGRTLEFDVNINLGHTGRQWWEIMLCPRDQLKVGAAIDWLPISETYPKDRIVFEFKQRKRGLRVGQDTIAPSGWTLQTDQWWQWEYMHPNDPALNDRRIRRTMRMTLQPSSNSIVWGIEKEDGSFDEWTIDNVAIPFSDAMVVFKTHAYTPEKAGNYDTYTFHWDNIRVDGPVFGKYKTYEANDVVYMQQNGNFPIGSTSTVTIDMSSASFPFSNPVLFGQVESPRDGQVLLSINGGPQVVVHPYDYENDDCWSSGWKSFRLPLSSSDLLVGTNTLEWEVGPRPSCVASWAWDGFSIKFLQIQVDE